jgi:Na+/proline symporter
MGGFSAWDWAVVAVVLVGTTLVGERLAGRQASVRDYFLGGRNLPWWAVAGSIVATEISAVTFLSLPSVVQRDGGDLTYLQLGVLAVLLAKVAVALWLVPRYFDAERYSPYDLVGERLGEGARRVAVALFTVGGVLGQAARVYLTAIVLGLLIPVELGWLAARTGIPPLAGAVAVIGVVAVIWTWIGGMAAVVWTDAILFVLLVVGLAAALAVAVGAVDGGAPAVVSAAREAGKLRLVDASLDPTRAYTLWAAFFAYVPWCIGVFGTDQLLAQRLFCCADARAARKAMLASNAALLVTTLAAFVGLALFAFYRQHPLTGAAAELAAAEPDRIFPLFILQNLPIGLKGLAIAGVFAAAISSLDSILAALAQSALGTVVPRRARTVATSRALVLAFGVALCALAVGMDTIRARYPSILDLALGVVGYTVGALLAGVLLALWPLGRDGRGYLWSAPLAVLAVAACAWLPEAPPAWPWRAPIGLAVAWGGGWLLSARVRGPGSGSGKP